MYEHPGVGRSPTIRDGLATANQFYLLSISVCRDDPYMENDKSKARTFTMATFTTNRTATQGRIQGFGIGGVQ